MSKIRWISYTQQNIPGNHSFKLSFLSNLAQAREEFEEFCEEVGTEECSMSLYATNGDEGEGGMIHAAKEFDGVGCPFDYPDKMVERGTRGGIRFVRC